MLYRPGPEQTALEMVTLDQMVPRDHLLRKIDAAIYFSFIHELTAPLYCADNGRPPLDPTLMFKALFIGYRGRNAPNLRRKPAVRAALGAWAKESRRGGCANNSKRLPSRCTPQNVSPSASPPRR